MSLFPKKVEYPLNLLTQNFNSGAICDQFNAILVNKRIKHIHKHVHYEWFPNFQYNVIVIMRNIWDTCNQELTMAPLHFEKCKSQGSNVANYSLHKCYTMNIIISILFEYYLEHSDTVQEKIISNKA